MNKISAVVCGCILGVSIVCQGAEELTFDTIKPVDKSRVMNVNGMSRKALKEAMKLHNLMVELRDVELLENQVTQAVQKRQFHENKLNAMEKCSVNKLSTTFKNPEEVWNKMTEEYAKREKDLTIYINASQTATEQEIKDFNAYMERGEMTEDVVSELLSEWQIGNEILTDVYANQDSWGERKSKDSPSFPLWEDQKYIFDKEWDKKYEAINLYFGVPPQGRPAIGDEKYDYARAEQLEKAHATYLAILMAKDPVKAAALPASMRKAPVAPRPLPPKMEHLVYLETNNPKKAIYPAIPKPWQEYEKENFLDVNPKGEMAEDFTSGFNLTEEAKKAPQKNRLLHRSGLLNDVDGAKQYEALVLKKVKGKIAYILTQISEYISIDNVDLLNSDSRQKVLSQLQEKYKELVLKAEEEVGNAPVEDDVLLPKADLERIEDLAVLKEINPEAFAELNNEMPNSLLERDKMLLKALKTDMEGRVFLNEVNAGDVDKMLKENVSMKAFIRENSRLVLDTSPIDDTCLNGGV
jgi:hypothetical protein